MRASRHSRRTSGQRGNALLEFAIMAPVMILVMFGVMDFSRIFYYGNIAAGAARAGTEYALLSTANAGNTAGMQTAATNDASVNTTSAQNFTAVATTFCQTAGTTATVSCASSGTLWKYAQVSTTLQFSTLFKYVLSPTTVTVAGGSTVRIQ
ncbi:MAG: TadE/TadG family type IV pilus assembly protein [Bryobacteraceae bacterium]